MEFSWKRFLKIRKLVQFPKSEPFNLKLIRNENESRMERKFLENLSVPQEVVIFFHKLCKFAIFYLFSSFRCDDSEASSPSQQR